MKEVFLKLNRYKKIEKIGLNIKSLIVIILGSLTSQVSSLPLRFEFLILHSKENLRTSRKNPYNL